MGLPRGESLGRGKRGVDVHPLYGNKNIEEWSKFTAIGVILLHAIA